ncbi:MAG: ABC transporter substrate-binding protein [Solirubrobacterales bacterium]
MRRPRAAAKRRFAALAALLLIALAAPAAQAAPKDGGEKRIVALTPFAANTLAELGVAPVGVGQTLGGRERYSPKLKGVEVLPLSHPNGPNLEQLASLDPDLVLSSRTWAKGNQAIESLGIEVVVREPVSIAGSLADTYKLGQLVGRAHRARAIVKQRRKRIEAAERGISSHPRVMLLLGVGRTPFTFLPNSWGGNLLEAAGAELLTGGVRSRSGFERISDEVVIAEDPEVIIAVPHANAEDIPSLTQYLRGNPAWSSTTAARTGRVYVSVDNSLLQAGTDVAATIRKVRRQFLQN